MFVILFKLWKNLAVRGRRQTATPPPPGMLVLSLIELEALLVPAITVSRRLVNDFLRPTWLDFSLFVD